MGAVMTKRKTNHTRWMIGTILGGILVAVVLAAALRYQGIERVIVGRAGIDWVSVRPLSEGEWRTPPGVSYWSCGVTAWDTPCTRVHRCYHRGSIEVVEDHFCFLWPHPLRL
jgi:hypothetical protein